MRAVLSVLLAMGALVLIGISAWLSFLFAWSLGGSPEEAIAYGIGAATIDVMKALAPLFCFAWAKDRQWGAAVAAGVLWIAAAAFSFTSAMGLAAQNRLGKASSIENVQAQFADVQKQMKEAEGRLSGLRRGRSSAEAEASIQAELARTFRVSATENRTVAVLSQNCRAPERVTAAICLRVGELRQELAAAVEWERVEGQVAAARQRLAGLQGQGATDGKEADAQAGALSRAVNAFTGLAATVGGVQLALIVLIALVLEIGSSCGLYAALGAHGLRSKLAARPEPAAPAAEPATVSVLPRYGGVDAFCVDKIVPRKDAALAIGEAERAYRQWCRRQELTPVSRETFAAEFLELCSEDHFVIQGGRLLHYAVGDARAEGLLTAAAAE